MTKSNLLILGDDPKNLLERHREGYGENLVNVTAQVLTLAAQLVLLPAPAGITPTPEFKQQLAVRQAIRQVFAGGPYWTYDDPSHAPDQFIIHNHVIFHDGTLLTALKRQEFQDEDEPDMDHFTNNPFDYWWQPQSTYLPLRPATKASPYHYKTSLTGNKPYFEGLTCSNNAVVQDVDLGRLAKARQVTTDDLISKAKHILQSSFQTTTFDWQPRYKRDWGDAKESDGYFEQAKPKILHERMPEHAKRIDYLLFGADDLNLFSRWGGLPIAGLITDRGYATVDNYGSTDISQDALFFQVTGNNRAFLRELESTWNAAHPTTLASIYRVHE